MNLDIWKKINLWLLFVFFCLVLIRTAWISDDAAITLRTVLNFVHGNGLVFNVGERVQAYTHTAWFFILSFSYLIFGHIFYSTFFVSILVSVLAIFLLIRYVAVEYKNAIAVLVLILFSQAFIDYCTSGLENPMSYLLLIIFISIYLKKDRQSYQGEITSLWFVFSWFFLNRPDSILLILPLIFYATFKNYLFQKNILLSSQQILVGLVPIILWTLFSLFYYGFPLPNTAYAKLGTGIPQSELILQGIFYFFDSIKFDPFTLTIILLAVIYSFLIRDKLKIFLSMGIILYLVYILYIGGDFMSGRFFSLPFFASMIILSLVEFKNQKDYATLFLLLVIWGGYSIGVNNNGILRDIDFSGKNILALIQPSGIADERKFYYIINRGLLHSNRFTFKQTFDYDESISKDTTLKIRCGGIGFEGVYSGPNVYFIDTCALANPLLSRLPMKYRQAWRIGHFYREIPKGYEQSLRNNSFEIKNKKMNEYYKKIHLITRRALFSWERINTIININLGKYDDLLIKNDTNNKETNSNDTNNKETNSNEYKGKIKNKKEVFVNYYEFIEFKWKMTGHKWNLNTQIILPNEYLKIDFSKPKTISFFDISFDHNDKYFIYFINNGEVVFFDRLVGILQGGLSQTFYKLEKKIKADAVIIVPDGGDKMYSIGHFIVK
jgi:arabinofuranosyltransferase